jgi:hypothetical protein
MAIPTTITITTASGTLHGSDFRVSIHVGCDIRKWGAMLAASGPAAMHGAELGLGCEV